MRLKIILFAPDAGAANDEYFVSSLSEFNELFMQI